MALSPDQIVDRYKLKSQITKWRLVALFALAISLWVFLGDSEEITTKNVKSRVYGTSYIGRVFIDNMTFDDFERIDSLNNINKDEKIKALVVHINSIGGSVVGAQNIYKALRRIAKSKPVVVVLGEVAASGGYMVAIGSDYIIAREGTLLGSIGVIIIGYEVTELAKKLGIEFNILKTSIYKASPNPMEKLTPETRAVVENTLKDTYELFFSLVKERRKIPEQKLRTIADGRLYTGNQAIKLGLIDAIGGEEEAIDWLTKKGITKDTEVINIKLNRVPNKFDQLLNSAASIASLIKATMSGLILQ